MQKLKNIVKGNSTKSLIIGDQALVSGVNFLLTIIITRSLGIEVFGVFSMIWLIVLLIAGFHQSFIVQPMLSLTIKKKKEKTQFNNALFVTQIFFCIIASIISFVFFSFSDVFLDGWDLEKRSLPISLVVFVFLMHEYFRKNAFANTLIKRALVMDLLCYGSILILTFSAIFLQRFSLTFLINALIFSFTLSSLYGILKFNFIRISRFQFLESFSEQWHFSKWLVATSGFQWFSGNIFLAAGGSLLGPAILGAIRFGQNIAGLLNVFILALENQVPVTASKILSIDGLSNMRQYLRRVFKIGGILILGVSVLISLFSTQLISIIYGNEYTEFAYILIGFCVITLVVFAGFPLRIALRTLEYTKPIFISYILSGLFGISLAFPIVKAFGIVGVLFGMFISQLIMISWYYYSLKKIYHENNSYRFGKSQSQ